MLTEEDDVASLALAARCRPMARHTDQPRERPTRPTPDVGQVTNRDARSGTPPVLRQRGVDLLLDARLG